MVLKILYTVPPSISISDPPCKVNELNLFRTLKHRDTYTMTKPKYRSSGLLEMWYTYLFPGNCMGIVFGNKDLFLLCRIIARWEYSTITAGRQCLLSGPANMKTDQGRWWWSSPCLPEWLKRPNTLPSYDRKYSRQAFPRCTTSNRNGFYCTWPGSGIPSWMHSPPAILWSTDYPLQSSFPRTRTYQVLVIPGNRVLPYLPEIRPADEHFQPRLPHACRRILPVL